MYFRFAALSAALVIVMFAAHRVSGADDGLVGHWKLADDSRDYSGNGNDAVNHGVELLGEEGARFNGIDAFLEVPSSESLQPGTSDFTVALWVHTDARLRDVLGDIVSMYDPDSRTGVTLGIMNYAGVTNAQSNFRNLSFGIDAGQMEPAWTDCGRPGNAQSVRSLTVHDGNLYASTWEPEAGQAGRVYRYTGGQAWEDWGAPDASNTVSSLAVFDGKLYAGTETYTGGGSQLPESPNTHPGGKVFRCEGKNNWVDCGNVADGVVSISGLAVFDGELYAGTGTSASFRTDMPRTKGMYRYEGGSSWVSCGCPGRRIVHLGVYNGHLYGLSYDGGYVYRYEGGTKWTDLGPLPDTDQAYSFMVFQGKMHICTWPNALVLRFEEPRQWVSIGRLGQEKEAMAISIYNGKMYVGSLPLAEVYRYDGDQSWVSTGQLDFTPDVVYRRAWSMAVFGGRLYCGTLPSGHVWSLGAGKCVTDDRALAPGWRHVTAVKQADRLRLFVDGKCVATSSAFDPMKFNLSNGRPLKIGFGEHDYFNGRMKDVRIYGRALTEKEITGIASRPK